MEDTNNKNTINKKYLLLAIFIFLTALLIIGGTVAYLSGAVNVVNGNYATNTKCFDISYTDNSDQITGTLFPSSSSAGGLSGNVSLVRNSTCAVNGRGTLYLNVNSGSSSTLTNTVAGHCENKTTLETIPEFNEYECNGKTDNTVWVTTGTALKYAIYDSTQRDHLYTNGYIDSSFIGTNKAVLTDFSITGTSKTFYIYVWLDGHLSDDTYTELSFLANVSSDATQIDKLGTFTGDQYTTIDNSIYEYTDQVTQYNKNYYFVNYIQSSGTQYIDSGYYPGPNTGVEVVYQFTSTSPTQQRLFSVDNNTAAADISYSFYINGSTKWAYAYQDGKGNWKDTGKGANTSKHTLQFNIDGMVKIDTSTYSAAITGSLTRTSLYPMAIFARNSVGTIDQYSSAKIFDFIIYENDGGTEVVMKHFVPCYRKSDGEVGLYDITNNQFYTDAGSGATPFTFG